MASTPTIENSGSAPQNVKEEFRHGLTLRSFFVCVFALLLMGAWIEFEEAYVSGGPFAENSPPNSAVAVILVVMAISMLLYRFRKSLRITTAELIIVYAALLVAAPLMTQGMWHRIFGLMAAASHEQNALLFENLPEQLWPHGKNLVGNGRFEQHLQGFSYNKSTDTLSWNNVEWKGKKWNSPVLSNTRDPQGKAMLTFTIPRTLPGREALIPGEKYLLALLVKADNFEGNSYYFINSRVDAGPDKTIFRNSAPPGPATPTFSNRGGFQRLLFCPFTLSPDLREKQTLAIGISGPGTLTLQDIQFYSSRAIEDAYSGVKIVKASNWGKLRSSERDSTIVKPDVIFSFAGLKYLFHGFIPWDQWVKPLFAWLLLIGALFLGFLGFNVIMRKQWVDNERYTFPMNIFPRLLFGGGESMDGSKQISVFQNKVVWLGFAVALPICLLRVLHLYFPSLPGQFLNDLELNRGISVAGYFTDPAIQAYFTNVRISFSFTIFAIALLVEKDILFSIWSCYFLFHIFYLFGKVFNFYRYASYPWDSGQCIGSFIAFAILGVITARRHLAKVFRHVVGKKTTLDDAVETVSYRTALIYILISIALLIGWAIWTNMGAMTGILFLSFIFITAFSASKIRAEYGPAWGYWTPYMTLGFITAVGGLTTFGSTGMLVATMMSGFMFTSTFFFIAPVQVEMMELGRHFKVRPKDIGCGLSMGLVGGVLIGGYVLLCWVYKFGADNLKYYWPYMQYWYFTDYQTAEQTASRALLSNSLNTLTENRPFDIINNLSAKGIAIGLGITGLLALLRNLFMWFPIQPLGYVLAPTNFVQMIWFNIFLAWLIRLLVLRIGGAHTVRRGLIPFSIGMFIACIISIIIFDIIGLYLHAHGTGVDNLYFKMP